MSLSDAQLRRSVHRTVIPDLIRDDPDAFAVDEMGLCQHSARIDIAVFNGAIHGFEIKSDFDTLDRLDRQVPIYNAVLDHVSIVTGHVHADGAVASVPGWWGVYSACEQDGTIELQEVRAPQPNPSPDPFSVSRLLWREEALAVLTEHHIDRGVRSKRLDEVCRRLAESFELVELQRIVRERIRLRGDWRSDL